MRYACIGEEHISTRRQSLTLTFPLRYPDKLKVALFALEYILQAFGTQNGNLAVEFVKFLMSHGAVLVSTMNGKYRSENIGDLCLKNPPDIPESENIPSTK